ncbi:MAG: prenyltransferase/squalene oxidase repeat-containing protein [Planctomycetota bacterium]
MNERLRRVLIALSGTVAVAAATTLFVVRVGRPLYYSDGDSGHLGAGERLRQAPMLMWSRPQPAFELPGPVRGRIATLPDGSVVYGRALGDLRTELVRIDPRRQDATPEPIPSLSSTGHDFGPSLSPDGRTLYFTSDRPHEDGGGFDLWCATVRGRELYAPRPCAGGVNTTADESDPAVDPTGPALVFVRRQEDLDARGSLSLWSAPLDGSAPAAPLWTSQSDVACLDRDPVFSADGRALWFVRQREFGRPMLMRAWRHAGVFTDPVALPIRVSDGVLHGPSLHEGGRVLQFAVGDSGLVYRAEAMEVYPWWAGQAWLEKLLALTLLLALLIWILLTLGRRWRALDVVTWCLLASLLLHVLVLLWLRGVEIVRHYRAPPARLGEIEVTLVASGSSVTNPDDSAPGSDLAQELRFTGHAQALTASAPASSVADSVGDAKAVDAERDAEAATARDSGPSATELTDQATAVVPRKARAAVDGVAAVAARPVEAAPTDSDPAARRDAVRADQAFEVRVPAPAPANGEGSALRAAPAGAYSAAASGAIEPPVAMQMADAAGAPATIGAQVAAAPEVRALDPTPLPAAGAAPPGAPARHVPDLDGEARLDAGVPEPGSSLGAVPARSAASAAAALAAPAPSVAEAGQPAAAGLRDESVVGTAAMARGESVPLETTGALVAPAVAGAALPQPQLVRAAPSAEAAQPMLVTPVSAIAAATTATPPSSARSSPPPASDRPVRPPSARLAEGVDPAAGVAALQATGTPPSVPTRAVSSAVVAPSTPATRLLRVGAPGPTPVAAMVSPPEPTMGPVAATRVHASQRAPAPQGTRPPPTPHVALQERPATDMAPVARAPARAAPTLAPSVGPVGPAALARSPDRQMRTDPTPPRGSEPRAPSSTLPPALVAAPAVPRAAAPPSVRTAGATPPARRVRLRDDAPGAERAALGSDPRPTARAQRSEGLPPTSPSASPVAPLAMPLAAPALVATRLHADVGTAEVSRGLRPPGSLLPLPSAAPIRAAANRAVAALPELYRSRFGPEKVKALEAFGGTQETEAAVQHGLAYLASIQRPDGGWGRRRRGHDKYGEVWVGKTGLCLLAFLGAGHTQDGAGEYSAQVRKALAWLLAQQDPVTGHFGETSAYSHGITTYALAECYALTKDASLRQPVERAVAWILKNQNRGRDRRSHGGWGYFSPTLRPEDRFARASVSAWMVMALKSAQMSGVEVPANAFASAEAFLWFMFDSAGGNFLYSREPSRLRSEWRTLPGSTPASVFCLLLLGNERTDERLRAAEAWIVERKPTAFRRYSLDDFVLRARGNVYFWYYGSLACFMAGGDAWSTWNEALKRSLVEGQSADGSFAPIDEYADYAGDTDDDRAYTTAMCVLSLEVYYRYFTPLLLKPK